MTLINLVPGGYRYLFGLVTVIVAYVVINEIVRFHARIKGFKGPPGLPLVGNLHQIRENAAETYRQWAKQYGAVYQIQLGNIPIIVVNSAAAARTIFGQNSQALSSRPEFYTFHKVASVTAGTTIGTSPYSESLKRRRKGAASALNRPSVQTYAPELDLETRDFIRDLWTYGKQGQVAIDPKSTIQRLSLSLGLMVNWGVRMESQNDELFGEITLVEDTLSHFRSTTGNLQDYVPILRLNPFNAESAMARDMRRRRDVYLTRLNRELDDRIQKGVHKPCIQANVILGKEAKLNKEELTSISLTMLSGGLDTITTTLSWSIGLLAQRPDLQDKAFAEIEDFRKVRGDHFFTDANEDQGCKYVVMLVRECLRYFTVLRLALPRATIQDLVFEGKHIPKGSVVFLNAWACNMDDQVWYDPEAFRPERWLEQPDAPLFTFGLGYRMCAGSLLANRELYLVFIRMITAFKLVAESTKEVHPVKDNSDPTSLVAIPRDYQVRFVPRDGEQLQKALFAAQ